jgi:hypothetical protein
LKNDRPEVRAMDGHGSTRGDAKVSVLFESNEHATRATDGLLGLGVLGDEDVLTLRRAKPWGDRLVPEPKKHRGSFSALGATAVVLALSCIVLMLTAAEGLDARGLVTALLLGLGWGALYGVLVGAMSGSTAPSAFFEQFDPPEGPERGRVEVASSSREVLLRARRHLLCCTGAIAERMR